MKKFLIIWTVLTIIVLSLLTIEMVTQLQEQHKKKKEELVYYFNSVGKTEEGRSIYLTAFQDSREEDYLEGFGNIAFYGMLFWGVPIILGSLITIALKK